jgi:hypothetical protein
MKEPSPRQLELLAFLYGQWPEVPTYREMTVGIGLRSCSFQAVRDVLEILERKGLVSLPDKMKARGIRLTHAALELFRRPITVAVPVEGAMACEPRAFARGWRSCAEACA